MNQFKNAWSFYFNNWQYFAVLAAPVCAIEISIAHLLMPLENISPEDIKKEVFEKLEKLSTNGGFILSTTHTIEQDIPIENILAIYSAVNDYYDHRT